MITKPCLRCKVVKPETDYQLDKRGRRNVCMKCRGDSEKLLKDLKKQWQIDHPGQTPTECECCKKTNVKLVLDHCHDTKSYRGWLCNPCNIAIGNLGDSLAGVMMAVEYLNKNKVS